MKNFGKGSMTLKRRERYCEMRRTACFGPTYGLFRIDIRQGGGEDSMAVRETDRGMEIAAEKRGRTGSLGSDRE